MMGPSGSSNQNGGAQSVSPSLLRSDSGLIGGPGPSQTSFSSIVSPRTQFNNTNMLGNQTFGNGGLNVGFSGPGSTQHGCMDTGAESDPLSCVGNGLGFNAPSSFVSSNPSTLGPVQGQQFSNPSANRLLPDQQQAQQLEQQAMQQFSTTHTTQQQQFQHIRGGLAGVRPVKMEPQGTNDPHGQQQPLQSLRNLGPVKMELQQTQSLRNLGQVKMEPQHSDQSLFLHQQQRQQQQQIQQQQQQQFLQMSRQSSQAAALLQPQRMLQIQQQQQQQQLLKAIPQQRPQIPQQFPLQNLPLRSPVKPAYEPGMCARRLTHYMYQQQHRPEDNNIEFWRKFVAEYFAPNAKKKWCVSMYGSGRQTTGVFPQDALRCEICNRKPGRGFEATVEVLPRLFKIKYESGTLEELLYIDMPREYQNSSGQIVLDYAKAIQESVFQQLRVVRDGQLRIVFTPDLKIVSWEFCAWRHEELIPRRLLIPQVSQLGAAAQKYQTATQNASTLSTSDLQTNSNAFVSSAWQLAKALEVPLVNDLGYTKRYVRCLQISEVVNSMKDLIDYSRETGTGPMESLAKYPRRTSSQLGPHSQTQQQDEQKPQTPVQQQQQQPVPQNSNNERSAVLATAVLLASNNGIANVNNSGNTVPASSTTSTVELHQNSMNSRQQSSINAASSPYGGNSVQMPSPSSSNTIPPSPSPFQVPTPSTSNNPQISLSGGNHLGSTNSPANTHVHSNEADTNDQQSSVEKILQEMMSSQLNGSSGGMASVGSLGNDVKGTNGVLPSANTNNTVLNGGSGFVSNGTINNNPGIRGGTGFGTMGSGISHSAMMNGIRAAMGHNSMINGRVGVNMPRDQSLNQQDIGNQLYGGLGAVNGFNNLQFDWKPSP